MSADEYGSRQRRRRVSWRGILCQGVLGGSGLRARDAESQDSEKQ
jgi:hypothetical protein